MLKGCYSYFEINTQVFTILYYAYNKINSTVGASTFILNSSVSISSPMTRCIVGI